MADQSDIDNEDNAPRSRLHHVVVFLTGIFLFALPFALFALLISIWPIRTKTTSVPEGNASGSTEVFSKTVEADSLLCSYTDVCTSMNLEVSLFVIVILAGALGSVVFTARAFALHNAWRDFGMSWIWWYFIRIPVGMSLALMLYLVLRGGLFSGTFADPEMVKDSINPFGFAAIATLAGMFSQKVSAKLSEIFDVIFQADNAPPKATSISKPKISGLSKDSIKAKEKGAAARTIQINGSGFDKSAKILVDGEERKPDKVSAKVLSFKLMAKDVEPAGREIVVAVRNPKDKGGQSNTEKMTVTA